MKKTIFYLVILNTLVLVAQNQGDEIQPYDLMGTMEKIYEVPKSPEVAAFEKYGSTPVNLYTGVPNISIPLYVLKGNEINLPISLTYDASGIKVDQISTNVGLGWNLNYGGIVSRQVNHLPDQLIPNGGPNYDWPVFGTNFRDIENYFKNNSAHKFIGPHTYNNGTLIQLYRKYHKGTDSETEVDTQPDMFSFNVNGISGTIIIEYFVDVNGNKDVKGYCFENPDIKVEIDATITTSALSSEINGWTIVNTDGTRYTFEEKEITWQEYSTDPNEFQREYNSAWYLTEVVSPNGLDTFKLNYSNPNFWGVDVDNVDRKRTLVTGSNCTDPVNYVGESQAPIHNNYKTKQFHLTGISYKSAIENSFTELLQVSTEMRIDLPNMRRYSQLNFKDENNQIVLKVDFNNNDYFRNGQAPGPSDGPGNTRLMLRGVDFWKGDQSKPKSYKFEYNSENSMPSRQCNAIDYWGYFTSGSCSGPLTAKPPSGVFPFTNNSGQDRSREPNFEKTLIGSLKEIYYPTGGRTELFYERHSGIGELAQNTINGVVGGLRIQKSLDYERNSIEAISKYYFYNDLAAKIDDGTYQVETITPNILNSQYASSGSAQQPLVFWESKIVRQVSENNVCNVQKYYQYSNNIAVKAPNDVTYGSVTEIIFRGDSFEGATVSHFYNNIYLASPFPFEPQINRAILNGEKKVERIYRRNGNSMVLMSENQNDYIQEQILNPTFSDYQGILIYDPRINDPNNLSTKTRGCLKASGGSLIFEDQQYLGYTGPDPSQAWGCPDLNGQSYGGYVEYYINRYSFKPQWKKLLRTVKRTIEGGRTMTDTTTYSYGANHLMAIKIENTDSKGNDKDIDVYYPEDAVGQGHYSLDEEAILNNMINRNQITEMVMVKQSYDGNLMSTQKKHYGVVDTLSSGTVIIRPSSIEVSKSTGILETRRIFHSFDEYGNPTEVSEPDGSRTHYVWGYKGKHIIAQIVNRRKGVSTSLINLARDASDADISIWTENTLRQRLNDLRAYYDNSQVTTYTYDPGIGLTSMTDPRGNVMYYEYDHLNRLEYVLDKDQNILSKNEYSYRINN